MDKEDSEISLLFEQLQSLDYHIFQEAIWMLQKHPARQNFTTEQLTMLYQLAKNPDYEEFRSEIIFLLSVVDDSNAIKIINQAVNDTRLAVQLSAVEALSRIGDETSLTVLETLDSRRNLFPPILQEEVIRAINTIKGRLGDLNYR